MDNKEFYKITVEKITRTVYNKTDFRYINKATGQETDWSDENRTKEYFETGERDTQETKETMFMQKMDKVDVAALSVYLNDSAPKDHES